MRLKPVGNYNRIITVTSLSVSLETRCGGDDDGSKVSLQTHVQAHTHTHRVKDRVTYTHIPKYHPTHTYFQINR